MIVAYALKQSWNWSILVLFWKEQIFIIILFLHEFGPKIVEFYFLTKQCHFNIGFGLWTGFNRKDQNWICQSSHFSFLLIFKSNNNSSLILLSDLICWIFCVFRFAIWVILICLLIWNIIIGMFWCFGYVFLAGWSSQ